MNFRSAVKSEPSQRQRHQLFYNTAVKSLSVGPLRLGNHPGQGALLVQCLLAINLALIIAAPVMAQDKLELRIDVSRTGARIDRNIFDQFAEHLGHGVYEGIWVGPNSKIPNTCGIRNDVVAALKAIKVPNVRWPGGCFADEYHWRKGIGTGRVETLNPNWGGVIEPNSFGTHEFMDFLDQIGAEAYLSVNVGSGTPQEANVLQAMIMTDGGRMVLTPTYHVFKLYVPFQDSTFVPVTFNAGTYTYGDITLPRLDAIAGKDKTGKLWLGITNVDPNQPVEVEISINGSNAKSATGETSANELALTSTTSMIKIKVASGGMTSGMPFGP